MSDRFTPKFRGPTMKKVLDGGVHNAVFADVYDQGTRVTWGAIRLHRLIDQPDVILLEAKKQGTPRWSPVLMMTAVGDRLAVRSYGVRTSGGENAGSSTQDRPESESTQAGVDQKPEG